MSKQIKTKLYELLYSWEVSEHCDYCQHMTTYRDNDNRHPCAKCNSFNRFKIAEHIEKEMKDKVKQIMNIVGANSRNVFIVMRQEEHSDYAEKVFVDKGKAETYCKPLNDNPNEYSRVIEEMEVTL